MTLTPTRPTMVPAKPASRFYVERWNGHEFPFIGHPRSLAPWRWVVMSAATISATMFTLVLSAHTTLEYVGKSMTLLLLPLAVLAVLSGVGWATWFRRPALRDFAAMLFYLFLAKTVSSITSILVARIRPPTSHPAGQFVQQEAANSHWWNIVKMNGLVALALPGEELFALVPFVALIAILYGRFRVARKTAIVIALIITALAFGAAHLPVYNWDYLVVFLIIAPIRIALTLSFIRTKNLWVPIGVHILFDWTASLSAII